MEQFKLSVIVACYNEENNIGECIERIHKVYPECEIVVVDDGSKDNTTGIAIAKGKEINANVKAIKYMPNMGKGKAIRVGIDNATGDIMAQVDADSQFPPEELPILIQPILDKKCEITFCSRFIKGASVAEGSMTFMKRIANFVVSTYTSVLAGMWLTDANAGFKAWTATAIRKIDIQCNHFAYEPEIAIMAGKYGYKIIETPVNYKPRIVGKSNVNLWRDGVIIPWYLLKVKLTRRANK
jgi:glycosyltransferase involved in cell wall biosynthesis